MLGAPKKLRPPKLERLESRLLLSRRGVAELTDTASESKVAEVAPTQRDSLIITTLGDSISAGLSPTSAALQGIAERASYRPYLEAVVESEAAIDVHFVGTSEYNMPKGGSSHSAYRGSATYSFFPHQGEEELGADPFGEVNVHSRFANGWATLDADVVLVLLGVNDLIQGRTVEYDLNRKNSVEGSMREMIRSFRADQPGVEIVVGTTPRVNPTFEYAEQIPVLNEMIHNLVTPDIGWIGSTTESTIHVVDHYEGIAGLERFDVELHSVDGVHPNAAGDELLAANWWSVLEPVLLTEASAPPITQDVESETPTSTEVADAPAEDQSAGDTLSDNGQAGASEPNSTDENLAEPVEDSPVEDAAAIESSESPEPIESPIEDTIQQSPPALESSIAVPPTESSVDDPIADESSDTGKPSFDGKKAVDPVEAELPDEVEVEVPAEEQVPVVGPIRVTADDEDAIAPEVVAPEVVAPEVVDPEVTAPEVTDPEVTDPEVTDPEVTDPEVTEPEVTEPEVTEPEVTEPEVTAPEVTAPEVTAPEVEGNELEFVDPPFVPWVNVITTNVSLSESHQTHFVVSRSGDSAAELVVELSVSGTAINGEDYSAIPTSVTLPAGVQRIEIPVFVLGDAVIERSETVVLQAATSAHYIASSPSTLTIRDAEAILASSRQTRRSRRHAVLALDSVFGDESFLLRFT